MWLLQITVFSTVFGVSQDQLLRICSRSANPRFFYSQAMMGFAGVSAYIGTNRILPDFFSDFGCSNAPSFGESRPVCSGWIENW